MLEQIRFQRHIPYYAQIASRVLAEEIFDRGFDPIEDPNWRDSGAASPQEYAYWVMRSCGIACLMMCVEAFGAPHRRMMEWIRLGESRGGYLTAEENGTLVEHGWVHRILAEMIYGEGLTARSIPATLHDFISYLRSGSLLIASVSYQLGTHEPITLKGGHLVVVRGMDLLERQPRTIYINNPSGRTLELQENAPIPAERFSAAYSGRIIIIGEKKEIDKYRNNVL